MNFDISPEQAMLLDYVDSFLAGVVDPNAMVRHDQAAMDGLQRTVDSQLFEMGIAGVLVDQHNGGLDLDLLTLVLAAERLGYHAAPSCVVRNALAAWLLAQAADEPLKVKHLPGLIDGSCKAAFAIKDENGWLPGQWLATEQLSKSFVEGAQDADIFIVGFAGGALGVVSRENVTVTLRGDPVDATRAIGDVSFSVGSIHPLSLPEGSLDRLRDAQLILHAADAYGSGLRALEMSTEYAKTRQQFGRAIGSFQGLKHQLANMAVEIYPARFLVWYAAHAWDRNADDTAYSSALAKGHVADVAVRTGRGAVEAHGGIGYTWEYPLHLFLKRAMFDSKVWGGIAEHKARSAELAGW